jgi:hypothetical protein
MKYPRSTPFLKSRARPSTSYISLKSKTQKVYSLNLRRIAGIIAISSTKLAPKLSSLSKTPVHRLVGLPSNPATSEGALS